MQRRLILDVLRRSWQFYPPVALCLLPLWLAVTHVSEFARAGMVMSMGITAFLGPMIFAGALNRREVLIRPITRRSRWRAIWVGSVIVVPVVLLSIKALPVILRALLTSWDPRPMLPLLAMSTIYDTVYAGTLLAILSSSQPRIAPRSRVSQSIVAVWSGTAMTIFALGSVLSVLLYPALASSLDEMTAGAVALLTGLMSLTLAGAAHVPASANASSTTPARVHAVARRSTLASGTSGLRTIATGELSMVASFLALMLLVIAITTAIGEPWQGIVAAAQVAIRQVFSDTGDGDYAVSLWTMFAIVVPVRNVFLPMLRRLRTLPLNLRQLMLLLVAAPALSAIVSWSSLIACHVVLMGTLPASLALDKVLLIVGLAASVQAAQIRFARPSLSPVWFLMGIVTVVPQTTKSVLWLDVTLATTALGIALLVIGVRVMYRSLAHRSESYAPPRPFDSPVAMPQRG